MPERDTMADQAFYRALPPSDFLGRTDELRLISESCRLLARGLPLWIHVVGVRGMGKTELLLQAANRCFSPSEGQMTAYLDLSAGGEGGFSLWERLVEVVECQAAGEEMAGERRSHAARGRRRGGDGGQPHAPGDGIALHELEKLQASAESLALKHQCRILVLLDGLDLVPAEVTGSWTPHPRHGGKVSWVTASHPGVAARFPGRTVRLGPLAEEVGSELLALAMRRAGVGLARNCRQCSALLGGVPQLFWGAAAGARLSGIEIFESPGHFAAFYAAEQVSGYLAAYHDGLLLDVPDHSIPILEGLMNEDGSPGRSGTPPATEGAALDGEEAIAALERSGLAQRNQGTLTSEAPITLQDRLLVRSWKALQGWPDEECRARLALAARRRLERRAAEGPRRDNVAQLRELLRAWDGQAVPRSLLDFPRFREISEQGTPGDEAVLSGRDRARLILPRVEDAWSDSRGAGEARFNGLMDLVALGTGPEAGEGERWLAVDVRLDQRQVTSAMVKDFERRCGKLLARARVGGGQLQGWLISGGDFSSEALERITALRYWSSGPEQLRLLARLSAPDVAIRLQLPAESPDNEPYAFGMVIPARADTELVAARALEQIGESLPLSGEDVARIKMALVEACLNAFEHGKSEDRSVRLTFRVTPERLEIEVFNRGSAFVPGPVVKPVIEEKFGASYKRGWGLSIIRELMDEAEFVPGEEGTLLRMCKYFVTNAGEVSHGKVDGATGK